MNKPDMTMAQQIAQAASAYEKQRSGHVPKSLTVVLSADTLVVTLRGTLSPAEMVLARSPAGAAEMQELHRQLFAASVGSLRQEITRITGAKVLDSRVNMETMTGGIMQLFATGTIVQVFLLDQKVPQTSWSGSDPG